MAAGKFLISVRNFRRTQRLMQSAILWKQNIGSAAAFGILTVSHSRLTENRATGGAGGNGGTGGEGRGGGMTSGVFSMSTVSHTTISDNEATGGAGGAGGNGGAGRGGGLFVTGGATTVCLEDSRITGNRAIVGRGGPGGQDGEGVGGGVYILAGTVGARHTLIADNFASTSDDDVFGDLGDC